MAEGTSGSGRALWGVTAGALLFGTACQCSCRDPSATGAQTKPPSSSAFPAGEEEPAQGTVEPRAKVARADDTRLAVQRKRMVDTDLAGRDVTDERVLRAMGAVPRHSFVLPSDLDRAYADRPLPIVGGQTISQPYIVAFMSQAAQIDPADRCLEIGTGSGYQAAVLTELCRETYSIEYLAEVADFGRANLEHAGYLRRPLHLRTGDGYAGWPEAAPFDAILVTAAPEKVPPPLLGQLALGGRLVIPTGPQSLQELEVWTRKRAGDDADAFTRETLLSVRFVPFLGGH